MTFTAYIQRQKSLIRSRNGIAPIIIKDRIIPQYSTEELFKHLSSLKGLNTEERLQYSKLFSHA